MTCEIQGPVVDTLDDLMPRCQQIAEQICLSAPLAVRAIKKVVREGLDTTLDEGLVLEQKAQKPLMASKDAKEGADAFAKKRTPQWRGE